MLHEIFSSHKGLLARIQAQDLYTYVNALHQGAGVVAQVQPFAIKRRARKSLRSYSIGVLWYTRIPLD